MTHFKISYNYKPVVKFQINLVIFFNLLKNIFDRSKYRLKRAKTRAFDVP